MQTQAPELLSPTSLIEVGKPMEPPWKRREAAGVEGDEAKVSAGHAEPNRSATPLAMSGPNQLVNPAGDPH